MAARRGQKGFSALLSEALDAFLTCEAAQGKARRHALSLRGRLARDAPALRAHVRQIRETWR